MFVCILISMCLHICVLRRSSCDNEELGEIMWVRGTTRKSFLFPLRLLTWGVFGENLINFPCIVSVCVCEYMYGHVFFYSRLYVEKNQRGYSNKHLTLNADP